MKRFLGLIAVVALVAPNTVRAAGGTQLAESFGTEAIQAVQIARVLEVTPGTTAEALVGQTFGNVVVSSQAQAVALLGSASLLLQAVQAKPGFKLSNLNASELNDLTKNGGVDVNGLAAAIHQSVTVDNSLTLDTLRSNVEIMAGRSNFAVPSETAKTADEIMAAYVPVTVQGQEALAQRQDGNSMRINAELMQLATEVAPTLCDSPAACRADAQKGAEIYSALDYAKMAVAGGINFVRELYTGKGQFAGTGVPMSQYFSGMLASVTGIYSVAEKANVLRETAANKAAAISKFASSAYAQINGCLITGQPAVASAN